MHSTTCLDHFYYLQSHTIDDFILLIWYLPRKSFSFSTLEVRAHCVRPSCAFLPPQTTRYLSMLSHITTPRMHRNHNPHALVHNFKRLGSQCSAHTQGTDRWHNSLTPLTRWSSLLTFGQLSLTARCSLAQCRSLTLFFLKIHCGRAGTTFFNNGGTSRKNLHHDQARRRPAWSCRRDNPAIWKERI